MLQIVWQVIGLLLFMIAIPFGMGLLVMQAGGKKYICPFLIRMDMPNREYAWKALCDSYRGEQ